MDKAFIKQIYVVSGVLITIVQCGMTIGFTSCLLSALQDPNNDIKADLETSSRIATFFVLAWIPGLLTSSYCMDRFGRRIAFMLDIIPGALGLLVMYNATDIYGVIAARTLEGMTTGSTSVLGGVVIGEFSDPKHRGMFLNLKTAAYCIGSGIAHFLGNYFHYKTIALINLIPFLFMFGIVWTWPESPSWLAANGDFERSEKNFYWLRGKSNQSTAEIENLIGAQLEHKKSKQKISFVRKIKILCRKFTKKNLVKPVILYFFAAVLMETSGRHVFPAYGVQIVAQISGSPAPVYYTLFIDIIITISLCSSAVIVKIFKRRTLLFTTGAVGLVLLMLACGYMFLVSRSILSNVSMIPLCLFTMFLVIVNLACAPIPLAMVGEIFPLEHKAVGTNIAGLLIIAATSIASKTTPILLASLRVYGTFTIFGVVMAVSLVFMYFLLPETKDKTLQEIENYFTHGDFNVNNQFCDVNVEKSKMLTQEINNVRKDKD